MLGFLRTIERSLTAKLIILTGVILLLGMSALLYVTISSQKRELMDSIIAQSDRLSNTIKLGTHYAMMLNSREDLTNIIQNIGRQPTIAHIRIYNKEGQIKFTNIPSEQDATTNIRDEACFVCHRTEPPLSTLELDDRVRIMDNGKVRFLGILSPVHNETGCSGSCHFHPPEKKILGAIDMVVSLADADSKIAGLEQRAVFFTALVFLATLAGISVFMVQVIKKPILGLMRDTRRIARGEQLSDFEGQREDEIGQLAEAVAKMGRDISLKQQELNRQRDEYQNLFGHVPCLITVQDKNFRLLRYNLEFAEKFRPKPGDHCYKAYKGRSEKCPNCPVETTFATGKSTTSEEQGLDRQGNRRHWLVTTSPICNADGEVVAAMEMSLDITARKQLERELKLSEAKYLAIFNTIPNPVFALDPETLAILDCNASSQVVYGYSKDELLGRSFLDLFRPSERDQYAQTLKSQGVFDRVVHHAKDGRGLYVTIRVSPSEYTGKQVLLVTTADITKRLETEQQLIQAGKMTTLGEMATGIAHELNQPLTVIKGAGSYCLKKIRKSECIDPSVLADLAQEIDAQVDRASKIINHLREFGRKPDMQLCAVDVGQVLQRAHDVFRQQLALRQIRVEWFLEPDLPPVWADPSRLEQVCINLLLNARDAIEERWAGAPEHPDKRILLEARSLANAMVEIRVSDTGKGIPSGVAERIFEPFFTTKPIGKGTGLGLSISYGIIQDCGGTIRAESQEGQGATFIITLPQARERRGEVCRDPSLEESATEGGI